MTQAARNVLQQPTQIMQMHADFNKVDIVNVQEQAGWVCGCDTALVNRLQTSFKVNLEQQKSLEQWTEWMEAVVDQVRNSPWLTMDNHA